MSRATIKPRAPAWWAWKFGQRGVLFGVTIIVVAVFLIYWPAIDGGWLWDDEREVAQNPVLREAAGLKKIWSGEGALDYFPLKATVQWLLWQLWSDHRVGWHCANIVLHIAGSILLWRLLQKLDVRGAWLGGFIFAIHPLAVESVAWIAEFKNTLSLPLALLSMSAYVDYDKHGRRRDGWLALLFFVAALLSKTSVIMLPVVFACYAWWKRGRIFDGRLWLHLTPFFGAAVVLGLVTIAFQHGRAIGGAEVPVGDVSVRFARAGLALAFYAWKSIWPLELMPVYPRWSVDPPALWMFAPWAGILLAAIGLSRVRGTWARDMLFAGATFVALLLPILGFVGMAYMHAGWVADHFAYPALPVIAGMLAVGVDVVLARIAAAWRGWVGAAVVLTIGLWMVHGYAHARNFRSADALWSHAVRQNPESALAWNNFGNVAQSAGELQNAAARYARAIECSPGDIGAHINLGNVFARLGQLDAAIRAHERAVQLAPSSAMAANSLGGSLLDAGRLPAARASFERALELSPGFAEAHNNLGIVLARTGDPVAAARHFETAQRLNPELVSARTNLEALRATFPAR